MSGITVPTIDQISGATVMIKLRNLITKFITFAQEVNDKIDEPLEQATQAVNTANLASQNATRASEVATNASNVATQASEDAENAVNIVQGYEDRLNTVEDYTDAIGDNVSALDTEIHTTRPYVDTNTEQTITAKKHIPTATAGDSSDVWVNKAFVQATDGRNNLVHNIGYERIRGQKLFDDPYTAKQSVHALSRRVASYAGHYPSILIDTEGKDIMRHRLDFNTTTTGNGLQIYLENNAGTRKAVLLKVQWNHNTGFCTLTLTDTHNVEHNLVSWTDESLKDVTE